MAKARTHHKHYAHVHDAPREGVDWWTVQYDLSRDKVVHDQRYSAV